MLRYYQLFLHTGQVCPPGYLADIQDIPFSEHLLAIWVCDAFELFVSTSLNGLDPPIGIVSQLHHFEASQPRFPTGGDTIVMKQVPFSFEFNNGMMRSPAHHRCEYDTLIRERAIRIVSNRVANAVGIAC